MGKRQPIRLKRCFLALLSTGLSACITLERHPRSGYSSDYGMTSSEVNSFIQSKISAREMAARAELGLSAQEALSPTEAQAVQNRLRLRDLEARLTSQKAKKQYYDIKPHLADDQAKIDFLSLPTLQARERYIAENQVQEQDKYPEPIVDAIDENDIVLGMSMKAVLESWGDPDRREVAGNPMYSNERWHYKKMVSSNDGFRKEVRLIYFEGGRVAGWETY